MYCGSFPSSQRRRSPKGVTTRLSGLSSWSGPGDSYRRVSDNRNGRDRAGRVRIDLEVVTVADSSLRRDLLAGDPASPGHRASGAVGRGATQDGEGAEDLALTVDHELGASAVVPVGARGELLLVPSERLGDQDRNLARLLPVLVVANQDRRVPGPAKAATPSNMLGVGLPSDMTSPSVEVILYLKPSGSTSRPSSAAVHCPIAFAAWVVDPLRPVPETGLQSPVRRSLQRCAS